MGKLGSIRDFMKSLCKRYEPDLSPRIQKSERRYSAFLFVPAYIFLAWLLLFHLYMAEPIVEMVAGTERYENIHTSVMFFEYTVDKQRTDLGTVNRPDADGRIEINTASESLLEELPGIGAEKARRICEIRFAMNGFKSIEDLMNVDGIGEKTFEKIKDYVYVLN